MPFIEMYTHNSAMFIQLYTIICYNNLPTSVIFRNCYFGSLPHTPANLIN